MYRNVKNSGNGHLRAKVNLNCGYLSDNISGHLSDTISIDLKIERLSQHLPVLACKEQLHDMVQKYCSGENISREQNTHTLGFKYQARAELLD